MSGIAANRVKSSWTPLTNEQANRKPSTDAGTKPAMASNRPQFKPNMMFEERRTLVGKWFDKWNDVQRKQVIEDLLSRCKVRQIEFMGDLVNQRRPIYHDDFTRHLPRVLSLYIFSFLDPRSLSRCGRVCWHWKNLTEVDQLWLPKCVKLGWMLSFSPSPYEVGIWKRFYIENVTELKAIRPKEPVVQGLDKLNLSSNGMDTSRSNASRKRTPRPHSGRPSSASGKRPPWKGSDNTPQDTWRNNYLDNDDEMEKVNKLRKKGMLVGNETAEMLKRVKTKVNTGQKNRPSTAIPVPDIYRKSKSILYLQMPVDIRRQGIRIKRSASVSGIHNMPQPRPDWAKESSTPPTATNGTSPDDKAATYTRPKPVKAMPTKKAQHRTPRDPPSTDLFPDRPWQIPDMEEYDSDNY